MMRDFQDVISARSHVAGFLHVSTTFGACFVHTYVMHRAERTLIATIVEWDRGDEEHAGCTLRSLLADGTLADIGEIAFQDAPPMPGSQRDPIVIAAPKDGQTRRQALLERCLGLC